MTIWQVKQRTPLLLMGLMFWLLLVEGDLDSLWFALPCLAFITFLAPLTNAVSTELRWSAIAKFLLYFVGQSLLAGLDLTLRLLRGTKSIAPVCRSYQLEKVTEEQRLLLIVCLNLMPGTLVIKETPDEIQLHQIHPSVFSQTNLDELRHIITHLLRAPAQASEVTS